MARQSLQWAMQARSDAFVTQTHLHEVNDSLEGEKSAAREWAATDAAELVARAQRAVGRHRPQHGDGTLRL